jgi:hypothetical protein
MEPTSPSLTPFAWVHKRDGRLVPFEADKISRALFAASESLGRPDAFMARELTDSILHFLAAEASGTTPTTTQVADLVVKVVRELGQPALARAFADAQGKKIENKTRRGPDKTTEVPSSLGPSAGSQSVGLARTQLAHWVEEARSPHQLTWLAAQACLRDYSLRDVFARDVAAVHAEGLLWLTGLETPLELAGSVVVHPEAASLGVVEYLAEARQLAGSLLAWDGPEYRLARLGSGTQGTDDFCRALELGLRLSCLQAVINLNSATPPPWAEDLAVGPLFAGYRQALEAEQLAHLAEDLLEQLLSSGPRAERIRIDWHLGPRDFMSEAANRLLRLARRVLAGTPLAFVFERPRRPIPLAEGVDRHHPAVLMTVGLNLPRLVEQIGSPEPTLFLQKLGSLARLALSAAVQKRDFLRRHSRPALTSGFLLDRARLVVAPMGLEAVTHKLLGRGLCSGGSALEFAQQVIRRLQNVLRQDGQACLLETCVDSPPGYRPAAVDSTTETANASASPLPRGTGWTGRSDHVLGLTPWDAAASTKEQLRAGGSLHAAAACGTTAVLISEERLLGAEEVVDLLRYAWQQTEVVRVHFVHPISLQQQLTAW